jgi:hypothetical protein
LTYLACLTLAYQDYGDEEEYPKVKDFIPIVGIWSTSREHR